MAFEPDHALVVEHLETRGVVDDPAADAAEGTDFHATTAGHVAITPLKVDLTDHDALGYWAQGLGQLLGGASGGGQG